MSFKKYGCVYYCTLHIGPFVFLAQKKIAQDKDIFSNDISNICVVEVSCDPEERIGSQPPSSGPVYSSSSAFLSSLELSDEKKSMRL